MFMATFAVVVYIIVKYTVKTSKKYFVVASFIVVVVLHNSLPWKFSNVITGKYLHLISIYDGSLSCGISSIATSGAVFSLVWSETH